MRGHQPAKQRNSLDGTKMIPLGNLEVHLGTVKASSGLRVGQGEETGKTDSDHMIKLF